MRERHKNLKHNKPTSNTYCYMAPSPVEGKGLFARTAIPPDTDIVEYDGPRVGKEEGEKLASEGNNYVFTVDRRTCIDGSVFWNLARYANHSCSPNAKSVKVSGRIYLRSLRPIAKGEEITYNYGYDFKNYKNNPCTCGSPGCVGYMVNENSKSKVKYGRACARAGIAGTMIERMKKYIAALLAVVSLLAPAADAGERSPGTGSKKMNEKPVTANGVRICTEAFGNPGDPAVLLIMGASASMLWWDEEFCRQLAGRGRFVIRYDNRDTGRSVAYEPGKPGYTFNDMADDAVGVLDAYGVGRAHIVGASLGGMIAQIVALRHPGRVLTLTAIMSSVFGEDRPDLPPMDKKVLDYYMSGMNVDWKDEKQAVDFAVGAWRRHAGSRRIFDETGTRARAAADFRRSGNMLSSFNHSYLKGGEEYYGKVKDIKAPVLVIHGTEDPVLPYPHGKALAREIPGAVLLTLEGAGHEINRSDWDTIINAVIKHTSQKR